MVAIAAACATLLAATAVLKGENGMSGNVTFLEDAHGVVSITGRIVGLTPNAKHGFHVHQFGDLTGGCASAGPHFNPYNVSHGAPTQDIHHRHVGDLGNIQTDAQGIATLNITDKIIKLHGLRNVVGRAVVVHVGTDDLGLGNSPLSKTTGDAGNRAGCGTIGYANVTAVAPAKH